MSKPVGVLTFPMHGQQKLTEEGYRTRDGHFIEWFGRLLSQSEVAVVSRPEPQYLRPMVGRRSKRMVAPNTAPADAFSWRIPNVLDRRKWWVQSLNGYRLPPVAESTPAVVWNPLIALSNIADDVLSSDRKVVVDLLDDWSTHYAFTSIWPQLELAYQVLFERADFVTANAEGTVKLARRYGRDDVELVLNGCDPQRFNSIRDPQDRFTVGYVGKIGKRVDLDLVRTLASAFPKVRFIFAGPILDREYTAILKSLINVELLGDVHYTQVPQLMRRFDLGWVPHNVGQFEVGGDVIKTYEYRAAGLPVLTTPVTGAGRRGLSDVFVVDRLDQGSWLKSFLQDTARHVRTKEHFDEIDTWRGKANHLLDLVAK